MKAVQCAIVAIVPLGAVYTALGRIKFYRKDGVEGCIEFGA